MPRARLLPEAGADVMSKSCSPRLSSARSCMGRMPSLLTLVELPFRAVVSETEGIGSSETLSILVAWQVTTGLSFPWRGLQ